MITGIFFWFKRLQRKLKKIFFRFTKKFFTFQVICNRFSKKKTAKRNSACHKRIFFSVHHPNSQYLIIYRDNTPSNHERVGEINRKRKSRPQIWVTAQEFQCWNKKLPEYQIKCEVCCKKAYTVVSLKVVRQKMYCRSQFAYLSLASKKSTKIM